MSESHGNKDPIEQLIAAASLPQFPYVPSAAGQHNDEFDVAPALDTLKSNVDARYGAANAQVPDTPVAHHPICEQKGYNPLCPACGVSPLPAAPAPTEQAGEPIAHARNCSGYDPMQECTCGLSFRQQIATLQAHLGTEKAMHGAWRKRAEEAESALAAQQAPDTSLAQGAESIDTDTLWDLMATWSEARGNMFSAREEAAQEKILAHIEVCVSARLVDMEARKDAAYLERNQVVAALAKLFPSGTTATNIPGWDEHWHGCVRIDLPTGQVSWHYHDDHAYLFADLPPYTGEWDGHDTPEKYRRLARLARTAAPECRHESGSCGACSVCTASEGRAIPTDQEMWDAAIAECGGTQIGRFTGIAFEMAEDFGDAVRAALAKKGQP